MPWKNCLLKWVSQSNVQGHLICQINVFTFFQYEAHLGPVYSLQRNPTFLKNFLTVGDWTARVWSEDCRESSILWTYSHRTKLTDGAWNPIRYLLDVQNGITTLKRQANNRLPSFRFSLILVTQWDGCLSCWDLLRRRSAPIVTAQLCDEPLLRLRPHEGVIIFLRENFWLRVKNMLWV